MQQIPDRNELMKIACSPAGQKLLALLQANSRKELESITAAAAAGNMQEAAKQLSALLEGSEAQALLNQLGNPNG